VLPESIGVRARDNRAGETGLLERAGDHAAVPVLPKAKGAAKRLRAVQPVRDKLAGRGGPEPQPEGRAVGEVFGKCPVNPKHRFLPNGKHYWCADCGRAY
jgi:hypothetical protein